MVSHGNLRSSEPEYDRLGEWLGPGDCALDIGANFGVFTLRMAELVGEQGRVFAFEPVPQTFAALSRVVATADRRNVTLLNVACSDSNGFTTMAVPDDPTTGENLYQASIQSDGPSLTRVCRMRVDDLGLPLERLRLVKIDVESHETAVLNGMWDIILNRAPVLIVENLPQAVATRLLNCGYENYHLEGSPNFVCIPGRGALS